MYLMICAKKDKGGGMMERLTIDETIEKHKKLKIHAERTNDKRGAFYSAEEHKQIAEWLEELKAYREIGTVEGYKNAIECYTEEYTRRKSGEQYKKAVDDFVNACKEDIVCQAFGLHIKGIERIAEKLKAGGENEQA